VLLAYWSLVAGNMVSAVCLPMILGELRRLRARVEGESSERP